MLELGKGFSNALGKEAFSILINECFVSAIPVFLVDIWKEADKTMQQKW